MIVRNRYNIFKYIVSIGLGITMALIIAELLLIGLTLYSAVTHNVPHYLINIEKVDNTTVYRATPLLLMVSAVGAGLLTYHIARGGERRLYATVVVVIAIVIILAIFGFLAGCGIVCPYLICHGSVDECSMEVGLLYVKYICECV